MAIKDAVTGDRRSLATGPRVTVTQTAWTPCCHTLIRLNSAEIEPDLPTVILCARPECHKIWIIQFHEPALAVWHLAMARHE